MLVDVAVDRRTEALKALAEPARWRIVERLAVEQLCVCHLVEDLELPQPLISHHLKVLRLAGLVESERFKQWVYYRLASEALGTIATDLAETARGARRAARNRRPCC